MAVLLHLVPYLKPYRRHMAVVIISTLGVTLTNLVNPWLVRELVQMIRTDTGAAGQITSLALLLTVVFLARWVFRYLTSYIAHIMAWSLVGDLRVALYAHLQRLSARYYADRQTGEILKRVISDTQDVEPLFAHYIPDLIVNMLLLVGVGVILFNLNPTLAFLTLLPMPILAVINIYLGRRMHTAFKIASKRLGTLISVVQDNLLGIKEIQLFTQEEREHERVYELSKLTIDERLKALKLQAILFPGVELLTAVGIVIVVWYGGQAAVNGTLTVEDLVAFILYLSIFYQPITLLAQMSEQLHTALAGADKVVEVLAMAPDVADAPDAVDPGRVRGEITFDDVSFDYSEDTSTLHHVSLTVQPGQTLALVGPTGAGKTTIASLIPRFYDVQEGAVKIDGIDVRTMRLDGLRGNVSMVLQDVFLFNGTVRDNIRYSRPDTSDDAIVAAAKAAKADEFIMGLPQGYDTEIGERGVKLSGGQKQRLAIARAVLKDAPILILDEATSSVDTETEAEIQEALTELMKGRTSIVIAHRLSTIRNANLILVLDHGCIVEQGRHDELIKARGVYQRLYQASRMLA